MPDDRRVERIRESLLRHDLGAGSNLDSGLKSLHRLEAETPGAWDAGLDLTLGLAGEGIDPDRVLSYGVQSALECRGGAPGSMAEWLAPLGDFVRTVHGGDVPVWSAVSFGVRSLTQIDWPGLAEYRTALEQLGALLVGLRTQGIDTDRLVNYGIGSLCEGVRGRAWALEPAFRVAKRVAATGGEPGWIWQECVREWAAVLVPEDGGGQPAFERAMELLGDFLDQAPDAGMSAGSRLSEGLATLARYGAEMSDHLEGWLDLLLALIRSMASQDMSPYLPIGQGLAGLVGHVQADELDDALAFTVRLVDRGIHPGGILYEAFLPAASALGTQRAIELGRRLGDQGFDPYFVLRDAAARVGDCARGWPDEQREEHLERCLELLAQAAGSLHASEQHGRKYFEDAVPFQAERAAGDPAQVLEALEHGAQLAARGIAPGMTIAYGWATVLELAEGRPWMLDEGRAALDELSAAGIDPNTTLVNAFPVLWKVSGGSEAEFTRLRETLVRVAKVLSAAGVDPRDVLYRDVSAIADVGSDEDASTFAGILDRLGTLLVVMEEGGVSPQGFFEKGLPAAARVAKEEAWRLDACFGAIERMARDGRDGGVLLENATGPIAAVDGGDRAKFEGMLLAVEAAYQRIGTEAMSRTLAPLCEGAAEVSGGDPGRFDASLAAILDRFSPPAEEDDQVNTIFSALPLLAQLAGPSAEDFGSLADHAHSRADALIAAQRNPSDLLWYGLRSISMVARGQATEGRRCIQELGELLIAEPAPVGRALVRPSRYSGISFAGRSALEVLARATQEDAAGFRRGLPLLFRVGDLFAQEESVDGDTILQLVRFVGAIPPATVDSLETELGWLVGHLGSGTMRTAAARIASGLDQCLSLVQRFPAAWPVLLRPTIVAHGPRSGGLLSMFRWIGDRYLDKDSDFEVLGDIVTQFGVRVPEIFQGLIVAGLHTGAIADLTSERDGLLDFLHEVPLADSEIYRAYRKIQRDETLSDAQKREQVADLQASLHELADAVRSGEVSVEQSRAALLPLVLFYVFPPGTSASRDMHMRLFQQFPDHADHLAARDPGEDLRRRPYSLPQGAWMMRPGVELDLTAWNLVTNVAEETPRDLPEEALVDLGWDLLGRWAEGRIGRDGPKRDLLSRVLARIRRAGRDVPVHADAPVQLIECKEFLGDQVRDVVEQGLIAARDQDPGRYDRMVRDKIAPGATIGSGLIKSMQQLAQALRSNTIPEDQALTRIEGQLRLFTFDSKSLLTQLAACETREAVRGLLGSLRPIEVEIEVGKEQSRLLADFVGQELHAMQRELFGGPDQPAKLVYEISDTAPPLVITLELTKRKAHAPIGLTEGVCVASDLRLWDRPEFFQVIFWGPEGIAAGGMHVLIVREDGKDYLTLPGINPSPRLLDTVEPSGVLDFTIDYAWALARRWGCAGVWLPRSTAIHSNRRAIHLEVDRRAWPVRSTSTHPFSYSPYRYTFAEVLEVPEPEARVPGSGAAGG